MSDKNKHVVVERLHMTPSAVLDAYNFAVAARTSRRSKNPELSMAQIVASVSKARLSNHISDQEEKVG